MLRTLKNISSYFKATQATKTVAYGKTLMRKTIERIDLAKRSKVISDNISAKKTKVVQDVFSTSTKNKIKEKLLKSPTVIKDVYNSDLIQKNIKSRNMMFFIGSTATMHYASKLTNNIENEERQLSGNVGSSFGNISSFTDFGSPLHLAKTATKTITRYKSSVRKGIVTNVNSVINSNQSIKNHKKAIGHYRY